MRTQAHAAVLVALVVVPAALATIGFEAFMRWRVYAHFASGQAVVTVIDRDLAPGPVDQAVGRDPIPVRSDGFYFSPNARFSTLFASGGKPLIEYSVRTNSLGYLSENEYRAARDPAAPEHRIVVLGDSMTGHTTATRQWVDALEDVLNASAELKAWSRGKAFRTYNLGWPGAGFPHFAKALREKGLAFDPDLVVVNFIENDFGRTLEGPHLADGDAKAAAAGAAAREIAVRPAIFAAVPLFAEIFPERAPKPLSERLHRAIAPAPVIDMRDYLPAGADADAARAWYNLPWDTHFSDLGGEIYARALAGAVAERLTGRHVDFRMAKSRHFDPSNPVPAARNPILRIASDPAGLERLARLVGDAYARTRALDFGVSLGWLALTGRKSYLYQRPLDVPLHGAFLPVRYGPNAADEAWVAMACAKGPAALDNPRCWQWFVFYVRD